MKQFIYLDTDIANSIVSQAYDGLLRNFHEKREGQKETGKEKSSDSSTNIKTELNPFKIFNIGTNLKLSAEETELIKQNNVYQKITDKILHDKVYDYAYNSIKNLIVDEHTECDFGEYIEISRAFTFIDINYIKKIISNEIIKNYIDPKLLNEQVDINKVFDLIHDFIPYERMLLSYDGFLIPLDDKYLRVNPKNIGFMYGGELKCVGMITNIIGKDIEPIDDADIFSYMQFSINEMLRQILPIKEDNICVVHPIAIYYNK